LAGADEPAGSPPYRVDDPSGGPPGRTVSSAVWRRWTRLLSPSWKR